MSIPIVGNLPGLTTAQMREVDRIMVEDLGIDLPRMMENAGRHLAGLARRRYQGGSVTVLAGPGGNGGGGLVAARHLANRGVDVAVSLARPREEMSPIPAEQAAILERMGVGSHPDPRPADLVIDALLGYSLVGDPRGRAAELITWANEQESPVLSLDTPSGLDTTTGALGQPCVFADATLTLALPKTGLVASPQVVGALYLADISVPAAVFRAFEIDLEDPFSGNGVVRVG